MVITKRIKTAFIVMLTGENQLIEKLNKLEDRNAALKITLSEKLNP